MRVKIISTYISRAFLSSTTLIFIPLYISILGVEKFAIISVSIIVIAILLILDLGISAAVGREMARSDISEEERVRAFRFSERFFLVLSIIAGAGGILASGWLGRNFLESAAIASDTIELCLVLISIEAALQLTMRFYTSVAIGLEKQIEASIFLVCWTLLRNGVVVLVIMKEPALPVFFGWQLIASAASIFALKLYLTQALRHWPRVSVPLFDRRTFTRMRGFATGMMLVSVVAVANTQMDRLIISGRLSLYDLAVYSLAAYLGTALLMGATPIVSAIQPRLTSHFSAGHYDKARALYERASRSIALLVVPPAVVLAGLAQPAIFAWTGDMQLAKAAAEATPFLVLGYLSIALTTVTFAVAVANGYTLLNNVLGSTSLVISMPGYFWAAGQFGVVGVASAFFGVQLVVNLLFSFLICRKFLGGGFAMEALVNFGPPLVGAILGVLPFLAAMHFLSDDRLLAGTVLGLAGVSCLTTSAFVSFLVWRAVGGVSFPDWRGDI